jgi:ubiquinone biosynthesis protein
MADNVPANLDLNAFVSDVTVLVETAPAAVSEFSVAKFAFQMFDIQRRHGVQATASFIRPVHALLMLEGNLKALSPALDFRAEARPFIYAALSGDRGGGIA